MCKNRLWILQVTAWQYQHGGQLPYSMNQPMDWLIFRLSHPNNFSQNSNVLSCSSHGYPLKPSPNHWECTQLSSKSRFPYEQLETHTLVFILAHPESTCLSQTQNKCPELGYARGSSGNYSLIDTFATHLGRGAQNHVDSLDSYDGLINA